MANNQEQPQRQNNNEYGVLLYYKYTTIPNLQFLLSFYGANCTSLSLLGRVRLSSHGVNVTIGGTWSSLEKHIAAVKSISLLEETHFKLASSHYPLNDKESVTFSPYPLLKPPDVSNAGKHLSAVEFHSVLHCARQCVEKESSSANGGLVLLDARNLYETRIG